MTNQNPDMTYTKRDILPNVTDPSKLSGWDRWHAEKSQAKRAWMVSCGSWWRAQCDQELKTALSEARRGLRECQLRVTWGVERVLRAEINLASKKGIMCASCATVAKRAGVCRRTVTYVNRQLELLGVLRRHSSGGAMFGPNGEITSRTSNVYRFSHQQLRRLLGIPLRGQSIYESNGQPATRAMKALSDGVRLAYERHRVSPFHVCDPRIHPWYDERGYKRAHGFSHEEFTHLYSMWKSPGRARVCTLPNDNSVKDINLQRETYLSNNKRRMNRAIALLKPLCSSPRPLASLFSIAELSQSLATSIACDAAFNVRNNLKSANAADWAVVDAIRLRKREIARLASERGI